MTDKADRLADIFAMQARLNDAIFQKQNICTPTGEALTMKAVQDAVVENRLGVLDVPNQWLANYAHAMREELTELDAELLWKWWSKDTIDLQNIRVELIDILHFLISAMMAAGMNAEDVYDIYQQKNAVNHRRQDSGYNQQSKKLHDDNIAISVKTPRTSKE